MDRDDPIAQFFPGEESVDLYAVLSLDSNAKTDDIKKAYRRLALLCHPDKHANATEKAKADASIRFQQVGFAYSVLSDETRRKRYDKTGKTDEGFDLGAGEDGWEAYFEDMFDRVTRGKLDEMKKEYQGSTEEVDDLKTAYVSTKGSIADIMTHIPHSTHEDEARFIVVLSGLIRNKDLPTFPAWEKGIKDEKAKLVRKKQGEKEAVMAEKLAKELGVWDEFYGSGKKGARKGKAKDETDADGEDHSALQALILKKKSKNMDSFFDNLASKYGEDGTSKKKGKKRALETDDRGTETPKKKSRNIADPPDLNDEDFDKLQQKLFGDKDKAKTSKQDTSRASRKGKKERK